MDPNPDQPDPSGRNNQSSEPASSQPQQTTWSQRRRWLIRTTLALVLTLGYLASATYQPYPYDQDNAMHELNINYASEDAGPPHNQILPEAGDSLDTDLTLNPLARVNYSQYSSLGSVSYGGELNGNAVVNEPGSVVFVPPFAPLQPQQCYNATGYAQFCKPPFENAAYRKPIEASNTCGERGTIRFCQIAPDHLQTNCSFCYKGQYPPETMNDNDDQTLTWWQSETMLEGVQYPNHVNITLKLGELIKVEDLNLSL